MRRRLGFLALGAVLGLSAQVANESNAAYERYRVLARNPAAPMADVLKAADDWVQTYERNGADPKSVPPCLDLARFYAAKGVRAEQVLPMLEKGVAEISAPGGFTQTRSHSNSPFDDDTERALAANVYTQLRIYDKARELLDIAGRKVAHTRPETLDPTIARTFEAMRFSYLDSMTRLAIAEGRKEEALGYERLILTNPNNVAARRLIDEHRQQAQQLWKDLGKSGDFDSWLSAR